MGTRSFHARVRGVVQGVAFRYHTRDAALALGLTGWVRNLPNGEVEVSAEGEEAALKQLSLFLETGPPLARVKGVDLSWTTPSSEHTTFKIVY
jgi:acylphosphatase